MPAAIRDGLARGKFCAGLLWRLIDPPFFPTPFLFNPYLFVFLFFFAFCPFFLTPRLCARQWALGGVFRCFRVKRGDSGEFNTHLTKCRMRAFIQGRTFSRLLFFAILPDYISAAPRKLGHVEE